MANSIDWGTLALGALVGVGCRKQLKAASRIAASTAASLASATATAVSEIAKETQRTQPSEEELAAQWLQRIDQKLAGTQGQVGQNGQAGNNGNGN